MAEQKPRTKKKTRLKYKGVKAATFPSVMQPMQVTSPDEKCRVQNTKKEGE